jgi:phage gp29-like protein
MAREGVVPLARRCTELFLRAADGDLEWGAMKREASTNMAPPAMGTNPLVVSAEALRFQRQQKHNPLPSLKPTMLARALDGFEHGYLREAVLLWEKIAERDDVIASVKPKREKDVSQLDMQVGMVAGSGAEGEAHKAVLEDFWKNIRCVNSYDRNERGGFRRLVKQMMTAVSFRYAAHHIIWQPRADGTLRATFEFVPLWQFENRTGRLRYLPALAAVEGEILADGEWMVTVGDGLMISCCIGYLAKRSAFNDWLVFSEKFSVPGVLGRTTAKRDSPEGQAMRAAVESFGHDWVGVIYGDDGTHAKPIELVQANGSPQGMPMPAVVERVDRKFAALYRGADLSSMSSNAGDGTGASLQEKETDILRRDDAETIAETLEEVSRMVIEWHFGNGTEPLARVELVVPVAEDTAKVIDAGVKLAGMGARVSISSLMERAGIPEAKDDGDVLGQTEQEETEDRRGVENAAVSVEPGWMDALREDLQPLGRALAGAMQAGDGAAMRAAARKISEGMPEFLASDALADALGDEMAAALGDAEEVENAGNSEGAVKGWETRRRNGWQSQPKATNQDIASLVDDALDNPADNRDSIALFGDVGIEEARLLGLPEGFKRGMSRHSIRHIFKSHGDPKIEEPRGQIAVTREDIARIPEFIAKSNEAVHSGLNGNVQTIRYYLDDAETGTTTVVDEVRAGRKRLIPVQLMKFKKPGHRVPLQAGGKA